MNRGICLLFTLALLLITAHRLPAPISEIPETQTPAPQRSAKPNPKGTIKPKVTSEDSENSPKTETSQKRSSGIAPISFIIPKSQMTASATSEEGGYEAKMAIDGDGGHAWHTPWRFGGAPTAPLPQSITLNLGGTYNVNQLRYLPIQGGWLIGHILTYRIYLSTDGASFKQIAAGNWADDRTEKSVTFTPTRASYIRLEAVEGNGGHAGVLELTVSAAQ